MKTKKMRNVILRVKYFHKYEGCISGILVYETWVIQRKGWIFWHYVAHCDDKSLAIERANNYLNIFKERETVFYPGAAQNSKSSNSDIGNLSIIEKGE